MIEKVSKINFTKSLLFSWATLLLIVISFILWISFWPTNGANNAAAELSLALDFDLPEPVPAQESIIPNQEMTIVTEPSAQNDVIEESQPDSALLAGDLLHESSKHGTIPKIGPNGEKHYLKFAAAPVTDSKEKMKVAFVFSNIGRDENILQKIIEDAPAAVSLAFLPNSPHLQDSIKKSRDSGHEVLLNVPMEPTDYPQTDPGPNLLLTGLTPQENLDRLHWTMAQGQDYIGLMNYRGSLFMASKDDLKPVLQEINDRGLLFIEADATFRSQSHPLALEMKMPYLRSHFVLNEGLTFKELHATLIRAEQMAAETGLVVIVAQTSPSNVPVLITWIKKAQEKDFVFLPVSQIAQTQLDSSPTNNKESA